MEYLNMIGLLLAVGLLIFLAYRDMNLYFATLVCALLVIFTNRLEIWSALQNGYAKNFGSFIIEYFFVFVLGVLFGEVMKTSGVAEVIGHMIVTLIGPKNAVLGVIFVNFFMGTIGVSGYVLVFCTVPICTIMFKKAGLSMNIMPAAQLLGCALGAGVLPYNPILNNVIPTKYLGTSLGAQPLLGLLAFILLAVPGCFYCMYLAKRDFVTKTEEEQRAIQNDVLIFENNYKEKDKPNLVQCLIPCIALLTMIITLDKHIESNALVSLSLTVGILLTFALNWNRLKNIWKETVASGFNQGANSIVLAATVMGFAGVVQLTPAFSELVDFCLSINLNPYLKESVSINLLAGVTGSAAAGIQIFMESLSAQFIRMGLDPAVMHRLAPISSFGLNTLPHNATVVLSMKYMNVSYIDGYKAVAVCTILLPTFASLLTTIIAMFFF
ncbi:MAG: GntP family permease [Oscillibacter sp.]|nr:GntP family permease [Oscillibacter sp.]